MPPRGVPTFTPRQIYEYYSRRNILVMGDSLGRRFYTTLYYVMNAANLEDIVVADMNLDPWKCVKFCEEFRHYKPEGREYQCHNHTHIKEIKDVDKNDTMIEHFYFDFIFTPCYFNIQSTWKNESTKFPKDYVGSNGDDQRIRSKS